MILAACGGRGNGEKDAAGLAKAESGEGSGRWGGWTGRRGYGEGWMATGRGNLEGVNGEGSNRDGKRVAMGRGRRRWRGGNEEGGKMGRGQRGGGKGERGGDGKGEKKGQKEGEISQMDMMGCLGET